MTPRTPYAALAEALLARAEEAPLLPLAVYDEQLAALIDALRITAVERGALHLLNDDLPRTHAIAQSEDGELTGPAAGSSCRKRPTPRDSADHAPVARVTRADFLRH